MGLFGALSVFGCHIKGMIRLRPEQVWTCSVTMPLGMLGISNAKLVQITDCREFAAIRANAEEDTCKQMF